MRDGHTRSMRIAVLGGTRFIGVALIEELIAHGHEPLVIHRGATEADDAPVVPHVHIGRHEVAGVHEALHSFDAQAVVDTCAFDTEDAVDLVRALPGKIPLVAWSSVDVYRAFATLRAGSPPTDAVPLDEDAPVRSGEQLYPYRGTPPFPGSGVENTDAYEKLDVERTYLERGACVLRLPMVFGERDPKRREEFVLRRVRAGRKRIPIGAASLLWSKLHVRAVAHATRLAAERGHSVDGVLNVAERTCDSIEGWMRMILAAAGRDAELVRVADEAVPEDLSLTKLASQHVLVDSSRARRVLGWNEGDAREAVAQSVRWHLAHPPIDASDDFGADDAALAAARST
jgi:nucleoside-diphosphate-sugar epimerase